MRSTLVLAAVLLFGGCTTTAAPHDSAITQIMGNWHQLDADCQPPINELLFKRDGTFHVTWTPFETYEDYWGTYRWTAATGAIELTIDNGNHVPTDVVRTGRATITGDVLTFEGVSLGSPQNGAACAAPFHRRGPAPAQ